MAGKFNLGGYLWGRKSPTGKYKWGP